MDLLEATLAQNRLVFPSSRPKNENTVIKIFSDTVSMKKHLGTVLCFQGHSNMISWLLHAKCCQLEYTRSVNAARLEADPVASSLTKSPSVMNSLTHSANVYQLLIKCQSPFQAMGYTGVPKSGRSSYGNRRRTNPWRMKLGLNSFLRPEPTGHSTKWYSVPSQAQCKTYSV